MKRKTRNVRIAFTVGVFPVVVECCRKTAVDIAALVRPPEPKRPTLPSQVVV